MLELLAPLHLSVGLDRVGIRPENGSEDGKPRAGEHSRVRLSRPSVRGGQDDLMAVGAQDLPRHRRFGGIKASARDGHQDGWHGGSESILHSFRPCVGYRETSREMMRSAILRQP